MPYGGSGLVLAWLAGVLVCGGAAAGQPRRLVIGLLVALVAGALLACGLLMSARAAGERRAVRGLDRPGERLIGLFGVTLLRRGEQGALLAVQPLSLIVSNQRLLLHPTPRTPEVPAEHELVDITSVEDLGPVRGVLQQGALIRVRFSRGPDLLLKMALSTFHRFNQVRWSHLTPARRRVRALIVDAGGPTPARPDAALRGLLDDGKPVLYQFVLAENYLRIIGDRPLFLADLWWYFHWQHMRVSEVAPPDADRVPGGRLPPPGWQCLRLAFHQDSWMLLCAPAGNLRRLRDKALAGGAQPTAPEA